jgi:hypothetical protein
MMNTFDVVSRHMYYFFGEDFAHPLLQGLLFNNSTATTSSSPRLHTVLCRKIILTSTPPDNHTDQPLTWTTKRASGKG